MMLNIILIVLAYYSNGNRENPLTRKPYTNLEQYKSIANGTSNNKGDIILFMKKMKY